MKLIKDTTEYTSLPYYIVHSLFIFWQQQLWLMFMLCDIECFVGQSEPTYSSIYIYIYIVAPVLVISNIVIYELNEV